MVLNIDVETQNTDQSETKYIVFEVNFLLGMYHGKEWPPSPRRFFLALVSALHTSSKFRISREEGKRSLYFLEGQTPPTIHTPHHQKGQRYTIFVPDNNLDVSNLIKSGSSAKKPSELKSGKTVQPIIINKPIQYFWKINTNKSDNGAKMNFLCKLCTEITVLGFGIDPVSVHGNITNEPPPMDSYKFIPDRLGEDRMQVPMPGLLDDAILRHKQFSNRLNDKKFTNPEPITKYHLQNYKKETQSSSHIIGFKIHKLTEKQPKNNNYIIKDSTVPEFLNMLNRKKELILENMKSDKVQVTMLPSIGNKYADSMIRRVGFFVPDNKSTQKLKKKLSLLNGCILSFNSHNWQLELLRDDDRVLQAYQISSRKWRSVTPIELKLERNAKDSDVLNMLLHVLQQNGINPESVKFLNFRKEPYWQNFEKIPHNQNTFRRYVEFETRMPMKCSFLLGQNQESGFGLFAPTKLPAVAYFTILGNRPPIEKSIQIAELMRRAVMSKFKKNSKDIYYVSERISGHDFNGNPLSGHKHAFWLPHDADNDGYIDHIAVFIKEGFGQEEQDVFYHIKRLVQDSVKIDLYFNGFYNKENITKRSKLFTKGKSEWSSTTPYFMPWHTKKTFELEEQIKKECKSRYFSDCSVQYDNIEKIHINKNKYIPIKNFVNSRNEKKPINKIGHSIRISFTKPVNGPITLGFGSHFGLGMFMPVTKKDKDE